MLGLKTNMMFRVLLFLVAVSLSGRVKTQEVDESSEGEVGAEVYSNLVNATIHKGTLPPKTVNIIKFSKEIVKTDNYGFIIHGMLQNSVTYIAAFEKALLPGLKAKNLTVVSINWSSLLTNPKYKNQSYLMAEKVGSYLLSAIKQLKDTAKIYMIGHDLGAMVAGVTASKSSRPINYIYGLSQREITNKTYSQYYLRQDMGNLVQLLHVKSFPYTYGHRDFYFLNPKKDNSFEVLGHCMTAKDSKCLAYFCENNVSYTNKKCNNNTKVELWNLIIPNVVNGTVGQYYGTYPEKSEAEY